VKLSPKLLQPASPPDDFPDVSTALEDPNGLLAIGGDLSAPRLLAAYRRGIFPWYDARQPILWWCPDPRAVLFPDEFHVSRSLRRTLRRERYCISIDQAFDAVIDACARIRGPGNTWITPAMQAAYRSLHGSGHAHSIEVWADDVLAGGVYGVAIGRVFFGESMFSRATDASKVALVRLMALAGELDIRLIDCQVPSAHLFSLGSRLIPRAEFCRLLARYLEGGPSPADWRRPRRSTRNLLP